MGRKAAPKQRRVKKQHHPTQQKRGGETAPPERTSRSPRWDNSPKNRITEKSTTRKWGQKAKLESCSMMPLCERQRPMQVAMSGLLDRRVVCGERFLLFLSVNCSTCYRIQHGCRWPSLCGRICACTREVLGRCKFAAFTKVWNEHKGERSGDDLFGNSPLVETSTQLNHQMMKTTNKLRIRFCLVFDFVFFSFSSSFSFVYHISIIFVTCENTKLKMNKETFRKTKVKLCL